jgi:N-acetyl-anhydromuramyl-L-alanine amidase AmpD
MADYPGASDHFLPTSYSFSTNYQKAIVIHKTASGGPGGLQSVYNTFMDTMRSTHYGVDLDGSVWQFVPEARGAGGNCCLDIGFNTFWSQYASLNNDGTTTPNLNLFTFSIEHVDPTTDNSNPMPAAQVNASHELVAYLCKKYSIDTDHIHSHASIEPVNKARCPGPTYNFQELFNYVNGGNPPVQNPPNPNIEQAALDTWNSTAFLFDGIEGPHTSPLSYATGIAQSWQSLYVDGQKNMPPPTTREFTSIDWKGNPIIVQFFGTLRCEWSKSGVPTWIVANGGVQ